MARALSHRGPDNTRLLSDHPVGLAFTRLSIVDPAGGDQPLSTEDGSLVLIANGEVYNHRELEAGLPGLRLRTRSDCEVLLHLYRRDGVRFLDDVRGIYAVIIWDRARDRLIFARDRFGIKPLYFHRGADRVVFASEIKALFADPACPRRLDWESCLSDQMVTAAPFFDDRAPTTWFEGIESVPAGTVLEIDLRTLDVREHTYWRLPEPGRESPCSPEELVRTYGELLRASTVESGMSDAEIGLFLSGGIDSAAIAAFSRDLPNLHTFTALNGGTLANEDGRYAHLVAAGLGLPNHQVVFGADRIPSAEEWKRLLWQLETPLCGPEQFYKYELHRFARATRPDLKVMLLGQAADEFNGGYSVDFAGGGDWDTFIANLRGMSRDRALLDSPRLATWWNHEFPLLTDEALRPRTTAAGDPYAEYVAWKFRHIQQYNNWHEDRTAAGNGVEARVPFLDHRIVELTASIPLAERRRLLWDKRLLREAMRGELPEDVVDRPKVPFFYGPGVRSVYQTFARMLARDGDALLEEALANPHARRYVDPDGARATLRALESGGTGHIEFLLRLVNMGLMDEMASAPPTPVDSWPAPRPRELVVADWAAERARIDAAVLGAHPRGDGLVPAYGENVLLVRAEPADGTYFLAVNGSLEYVITEDEDADWLAFLRAVDGRRSVGEILADLRGGELGELIEEAIAVGVLVTSHPDPDPGTDPNADPDPNADTDAMNGAPASRALS